MYCTECGAYAPDTANFCPACGTRLDRPGPHDTSTLAIDLDDEQRAAIEDLPDLAEGTGMLVVVRGPSAGARFLLDQDVTTIGRHPDADLFLDDVTVSRRHAEIHQTGEGPQLRDLGSLNGTYVSGTRVEQQVLQTGDEVQVGRFKLLYVGSEVA